MRVSNHCPTSREKLLRQTSSGLRISWCRLTLHARIQVIRLLLQLIFGRGFPWVARRKKRAERKEVHLFACNSGSFLRIRPSRQSQDTTHRRGPWHESFSPSWTSHSVFDSRLWVASGEAQFFCDMCEAMVAQAVPHQEHTELHIHV